MKKLKSTLWRLRIARDLQGQDLIEYALLAGMLAVAAEKIAAQGVANMVTRLADLTAEPLPLPMIPSSVPR